MNRANDRTKPAVRRVTSRWGWFLWRFVSCLLSVLSVACVIIFEIADIVTWMFVKLALFLSNASEVHVEFYDPQRPIANSPGRDDSTSIDCRYRDFLETQALANRAHRFRGEGCPERPEHLSSLHADVRDTRSTARGISVEEVQTNCEAEDYRPFYTPPPADPFVTPSPTTTILVPPAYCSSPVKPISPPRYAFRARRPR